MIKYCLSCGKPLPADSESCWHPACYKAIFGTSSIQAISLFAGEIESLIEETIQEKSSISGVQKKTSLTSFPGIGAKRRTLATKNHQFILKTGEAEYAFLPEYENLLMCMAEASKLKVVPHTLFPLDNGEFVYLTKRIDRITAEGRDTRIPMEDFCQLSNRLTEYKYNGSYERCVREVIRKYSSRTKIDCIEFFRSIVFSYLVGNTDMHLKNFSLIEEKGENHLAPLYDLVPAEVIAGQKEMALTVNGKNTKIKKKDFLALAEKAEIPSKVALSCIEGLKADLDKWIAIVDCSYVPLKRKKAYIGFLKERVESI